MENYAQLNRAQLSFDYLHTNSTTHEFLFGAIAELIDNARDAGATELDIYTIKDSSVRGNFLLCFADNGCGMSPDEVKNVIVFGKSLKRCEESSTIGMYGNGLKSGSMRIGNDMMLFTKKDGVYTCLFLSRSFHEEEKLEEVIVPLPSFKGADKVPVADTVEDRKRHETEMHLILKYSPFRCMKDFFAQFDKLKDASGTVVIIYNMKLLDHGAPELDIITNPRDILLASGPDNEETVEPDAEYVVPLEKRSLRAYVSILYSDPRMKVYLQGRKVQTKRLLATLHSARKYNFASKTFRTRAEADLAKAKNDVKIAELRAQEAESKARDCELRYQGSEDPEHLRQVRRLRTAAAELRSLVSVRQNSVARKQKSIRDPKTLTFYFGVNVMNRACDGMFVYNCSRLIKMYQRIGPQQDSSMMCRGVVGIVDVPYMVLEPTHNKQDFADAKEYRQLLRAMADHLMQYWDDLGIDKEPEDLVRFWKSFGYLSARWRDPPSGDEKYARRRCCSVSVCVQCDKCLKWRVLPFSQSLVGRDVPDTWQCRDNPDHKHKRCEDPEEDLSPPMGVLKRKIKTKEQRQAELEKQIRKKQEELELIQDPEDENDTRSSSTRNSRSASGSSTKPAIQISSPRKRPPAATPGSTLPTKRPTHPTTPPSRAMTVAEKKRQISNSSNGCASTQKRTGLPLPTTNQRQPPSGGLVPKVQREMATKNRRTVIEDEEEDEDEEEGEKERTGKDARRNVPREKPTDKSKSAKAPVSSEQTTGPKTFNGQNINTDTSDTATANCERVAYPNPKEQTNASKNISDVPSGPNAAKGVTSSDVVPTQMCTADKEVPSLSSADMTVLNKRIHEKFKVCLRYFLPPEWPMQKDQIHTLTETELANFPLEDFFDRYEQGLRSLLATFQQETKVCVERLEDLRSNVVKLLQHIEPSSSSVPLEGDAVDQYLQKFLDKR
ncbi:MORC family CW-type zinc finger protein 2 [Fasciola hepatica]|uniref:MORC family CW-type zinc finger protein 2 n=1 Tax=Fasciola hepatica TaxID=6192 RepID=A0A4E0RDQ7_FASHE|nr:MORC family CW-type zinc finger protein 2 [Fasciola hepatica]